MMLIFVQPDPLCSQIMGSKARINTFKVIYVVLFLGFCAIFNFIFLTMKVW